MKSVLIQWNSHSRGVLPRSVITAASAATRRPSLVRPYHPVAVVAAPHVSGMGSAAGEAGPILVPPSCGHFQSPRQPPLQQLQLQSGRHRLVVQSRRTLSSVAAVTDTSKSTVDDASTTPTTSTTTNTTNNNQPNDNNNATASTTTTATTPKARLGKELTREMLRTRKLWMALDDDFVDIKEAMQEEFQVTYGPDATTLRCRLEPSNEYSDNTDDVDSNDKLSSSLATYLQIVCSTADTALLQESAKEAHKRAVEAAQKEKEPSSDKTPKGTIKVNRSEVDDTVIEYRPPGMEDEKDPANAGQPRVLGITFQVRMGKIGAQGKPLDSALLIDCGMDVCDSEIHILHVDYECGGGGPSGISSDDSNKSTTTTLDRRKVSVSHKFRLPTETYEAFQKFLSEHCGIDENVAKFLMNYNIFRRQQNKLKFLQGVKSVLE